MISVEESTARDAESKLAQAASVREGWEWDGAVARHVDGGEVRFSPCDGYLFHCSRGDGDRLMWSCFEAMDWVEAGK